MIYIELPAVFGSARVEARIDDAVLDAVAQQLMQCRSLLAHYVDGTLPVLIGDQQFVANMTALRTLLERGIGVHLTLHGEARPPSGTSIVRGSVQAQRVSDHATAVGVEIDEVYGGASIQGETTVTETVSANAEVYGARVRRIGGTTV